MKQRTVQKSVIQLKFDKHHDRKGNLMNRQTTVHKTLHIQLKRGHHEPR